MKKILIFLIFSVFILAGEMENVIRVSGKASIEAPADLVILTLGSSNEAKDARSAQQKVNVVMEKFISQAKPIVGLKNIQSEAVKLSPKYEFQDKRRVMVGYEAIQTVRIKTDKLTEIGRIIDLAVSSGLNNVSNLSYATSKEEKLQQEALQAAVKNAEQKAKLIAKSAQIKDYSIKEIQEGYSQTIGFRKDSGLLMSAMSAETNVIPGTITIQAEVNCVYKF